MRLVSTYYHSPIHLLQTNSFQTAVVTDGSHSYSLHIYQCGALTTDSVATIGFKADENFYQNHPYSGSNDIIAVACLEHPKTVWSSLIFDLTQTSGGTHCT